MELVGGDCIGMVYNDFPERIGMKSNYRDLDNTVYRSPYVTRDTSFVTIIPEEVDGVKQRAVDCTCGRRIPRRMGVDNFSCAICGRNYTWMPEITGKENFAAI